ncbi:MAG: TrkH family potassium uptake protein [Bacteroidetes bacterium]|nr:MAG: TrkH family potassium uptake protein [Bacteroidota bacterium]
MAARSDINFRLIIKFIGLLLMLLSGFMAISAVWDIVYQEGTTKAILISALITFGVGLSFYQLTRNNEHKNIGKKEGYIIVTFTWLSITFFGTLPFYLSGHIPSFTDAFFETMSGFTTTGATILTDIEAMPKTLLFWRSTTHWLGGMGIIVLTLAILPILGVGGMQLFVAEAPGTTPARLHPRITETAKRLWFIYLLLTLVLILLLMLGNMNLFESINHAFSTVATGGFSPKNDSIAGYSPYIQYTITLFMIIAGTNFTLHYFALKGQFDKIRNNEEFRFYLLVIGIFTVIFTATTYILEIEGIEESFRHSIFQIVAILTTTGFVTIDYTLWNEFLWFMIFILMFTGGCIGSTAGGIKMVRHLLLIKNTHQEFKRLVHPDAVLPTRLDGKTIPNDIIYNFLAFFLLYVSVFVIGATVMSFMGLGFKLSLASVAASIGNVGPSLGTLGPMDSYAIIPAPGKWMLAFLMLLGRLELFTVLILLTPAFWKK